MAYWARKAALDDVNAIFHIDPGPLPMTVWAATALNLISGLLAVFFLAGSIATFLLKPQGKKEQISGAPKTSISRIKRWEDAIMESTAWEKLTAQASSAPSPIVLKRWWILVRLGLIRFRRGRQAIRGHFPKIHLWWSRFNHRRRGRGREVMAVAVFSMSLIGWMYAYGQLNETARRQKLYMIALFTDFNSKFECAEFKPAGKVALFIGPDQSKVLLAPEYDEVPDPSKPFLIGTKEIPRRFPILGCTPLPPKLEEWERENNVKSEITPDKTDANKARKYSSRVEPL